MGICKIEKHRGYTILVEKDFLMFSGEVWLNGDAIFDSVRGITGDGCLTACKDLIDREIDNA